MFNKIKNIIIAKILAILGFGAKGVYTVSIYGADGSLKSSDTFKNLIPNEGLIDILKCWNGQATAGSKYIGLGTATYTPVATETGATVSTSVAEFVGYNESARPQWVIPTITGTTVDNSASLAVFTANTTATVKVVFLITDSTKGGTAGKLESVVNLPTARALSSGDVIKIQYGVTAISS